MILPGIGSNEGGVQVPAVRWDSVECYHRGTDQARQFLCASPTSSHNPRSKSTHFFLIHDVFCRHPAQCVVRASAPDGEAFAATSGEEATHGEKRQGST